MSSLELPRVVLVTRSIISEEGSREILLVRRSANCERGSGLWEVPGGELNPSEDLVTAHERTVKDATGLIISANGRLVTDEHYLIKEGPYKGALYLGLYGLARVIGSSSSLRLSLKHDKFSWPSPQAALESYDLTSGTKNALEAVLDIDR